MIAYLVAGVIGGIAWLTSELDKRLGLWPKAQCGVPPAQPKRRRELAAAGTQTPGPFDFIEDIEFDFDFAGIYQQDRATDETKRILLGVFPREEWDAIEKAARAAMDGHSKSADHYRTKAGYGGCDDS